MILQDWDCLLIEGRAPAESQTCFFAPVTWTLIWYTNLTWRFCRCTRRPTKNKLSRPKLSKFSALQTDRHTHRQMRPNAFTIPNSRVVIIFNILTILTTFETKSVPFAACSQLCFIRVDGLGAFRAPVNPLCWFPAGRHSLFSLWTIPARTQLRQNDYKIQRHLILHS